MPFVGKVFNMVKYLMELFCSILMVAMCACTFIQIINRFLFGGAFYWTDEIIIYSMVWVTFMGSAVAVTRDAHTRIDFFISLAPLSVRRWILAFGDVVCAVFVGFLCHYTMPIARLNSRNLSTALKLPMSIVYHAVIVCGALMIVFFVLSAIKRVFPEKEKEAVSP